MKTSCNFGKIRILFGIYCALVIWIILFKMSAISDIRSLIYSRNINLIPFYSHEDTTFVLSDAIRNVVIFIPVGVYLKMLKIPAGRAMIIGACFSFCLELMQFLLAIGAADITDLITNTSGTIIGICVYQLLHLVFRKNEKLDTVLTRLASVCTVVLLAFIALLYF